MTFDKLKPFIFHGVELPEIEGNPTAMCPFCGARNKFTVSTKTGLWQCFPCDRKGNTISFLQQLHELHLGTTTEDDYKRLAQQRPGLYWKDFQFHKLAWDGIRWLIPTISNDKVVNLRVWSPGSPVMDTAGHPASLWGVIPPDGDIPIALCEGEWDALAAFRGFRKSKMKVACLSVPGAGRFRPDFSRRFINREVWILFDSDEAGARGAEKTAKILANICKSVKILQWPMEQADDGSVHSPKMDLREWMIQNDPTHFGEFIQKNLVEQTSVVVETAPDTECTSFEGVVNAFEEHMIVSQTYRDAIAVVLATLYSVALPGDQLWLFLVGPPGSGKTTMIEPLDSAPQFAELVSKLTPAALVSGMGRGDGGDHSLLPMVNGRSLIVKDFTVILTMPKSAQMELFGVLRDAYDGQFTARYGTGTVRKYKNLQFSIVAAVTEEIHRFNRTDLGERFLKVEVSHQGEDPLEKAMAAIQRSGSKQDHLDRLRSAFLGFLTREIRNPYPEVPEEYHHRLACVGQFVACCRSTVSRDSGELLYRPHVESGGRLASQLLKLLRSLMVVFDIDQPNKTCMRIIRKVALDTAVGFNQEILQVLIKYNGLSYSEIADKLEIGVMVVRSRLADMQELGLVLKRKDGNLNRYVWQVSDSVREMWRLAFPEDDPSKQRILSAIKKRK